MFAWEQLQAARMFPYDMICVETIQRWDVQIQQLEREYPYLLSPSPELNKPQVFLSSIIMRYMMKTTHMILKISQLHLRIVLLLMPF